MNELRELVYTSQQIGELLQEISWLENYSEAHLRLLANWFRAYEADAEMLIIREGDSQQFLCIICDGSAKVVKENNSGDQKELAIITKSKCFGEVSLFDNQPRSASVYAKEDCILLIMNKANYDELCSKQPVLGLKLTWFFTTMICQRLRQTSGLLTDKL
jgi:CRP/FNR family cyclic AMP-dependent transcriptional regulator